MGKFIQFELWKNCHVNCKFCFNRYQYKQNDIDKTIRLNEILNVLNSDQMNDFTEIGFIGGEFFDDQLDNIEVKNLFYKCLDKISTLMKSDKIFKFYIATSLIFDFKKQFDEFLQFFIERKLLKRIMICTSYDIEGRFNENTLILWQNNMKHLHEKYPMLKTHTQIILSQNFIENVLNDKFNIKQFEQEYHTLIDYNIPHAGYDYKDKNEFDKLVPNFLPKRDSFLKFLNKTVILDKTIDVNRLFNCKTKADKIYTLYLLNKYTITNKNYKTLLPFGLYEKSCYIDSDIKMWDDIERFKEEIDG